MLKLICCDYCGDLNPKEDWNEATRAKYGRKITTIEDTLNFESEAYFHCPTCDEEHLFSNEIDIDLRCIVENNEEALVFLKKEL